MSHIHSRRLFLQKGLGLLAVAPTVPGFLDSTAMALTDPLDVKRTQQPSGKDGKILVVVQLSGGNDGLNTVIPYTNDAYHKARPQIGHAANTVHRLDDAVGLHPNLASIKKLYDAGNAAVIQGVGYPNPNRSHFRSMDIWQSGEPENEVVTTGWLGRYFDNSCTGIDPHVGLSVGARLPLAMQGNRIQPLCFERPDAYQYTGNDRDTYRRLNQRETLVTPDSAGSRKIEITPASQLDFLRRTAMDAQLSSDEVLRMTRKHTSETKYGVGEFANSLRAVAAMIAGGLPTRVYYVSLGGFDTHAAERQRHDQLMQQFADGIAGFMTDLEAQKNADRVLVMTFSEFGRRVEQNASGGTDHGAAAPMFLFGRQIRQGVIGKHPSLTDLDEGDLKHAVDFRSVYASVLQNWLETPSKPILGKQFDLLPVIKV